MPYVAISRSSGDIEIWSPIALPKTSSNFDSKDVNWTFRGRVPGGDGVSIEALCFAYQLVSSASDAESDSETDDK